MTHTINEVRTARFRNRVITAADILKLANIICNENEIATEGTFITRYVILCADDSIFESNGKEIFQRPEIVGTKEVSKIEMYLSGTDPANKYIELRIVHCNSDGLRDNYVTVRGNDTTWVNGMISRFNEIIHHCQKQPGIRKYFWEIKFGVIISVFWIYFRSTYKYWDNSDDNLVVFFCFLALPLIILFIFTRLLREMEKMWPEVELQLGADHQFRAAVKRRKALWIFSALGLPIITGLLYDALKSWFHLFQ